MSNPPPSPAARTTSLEIAEQILDLNALFGWQSLRAVLHAKHTTRDTLSCSCASFGIGFDLRLDDRVYIYYNSDFLFPNALSFHENSGFQGCSLQSGFSAPRVRKVPACYSSDASSK